MFKNSLGSEFLEDGVSILAHGKFSIYQARGELQFYADKVETLSVANHPNKEEMGRREVPFTRELFIEREDFSEEANNKFKRLVLDKEVRLRGAYVIKAQRVEKDENGEITFYLKDFPTNLKGINFQKV